MKNILPVIALLFLFSITSQAQFSIRGGLNFSTLDFSEGLDNFEEENKSGYHLGSVSYTHLTLPTTPYV